MQPGLKAKINLFFSICLLAINVNAQAQDTTVIKYPVAVLVQLRSEHNRIEALTKAHKYKELEEVKHDAVEVTKRMILDFHDNFNYCPVYYYMDTNADLIKKKIFTGILTDENGLPVKNPVINSSSDDYVIAYYGYPVSQSRATKVQKDTSVYNYDPQTPNGRGLVILNDQFLQLTYFYRLGYDDILFSKKKAPKKYVYNSKHFEIEYFPLAKLFNDTRMHRRGPRRIRPGILDKKDSTAAPLPQAK